MSAKRFALYGIVILLQLVSHYASAAEVGTFVPGFALPSLTDPQESIQLRPREGKLLYVDFWSVWCAPCREKMRALDALQHRHDALDVVGINVDLDVADAYRYVSDRPVSYPIAFDADGSAAEQFGVNTLPIGFLLDQQGVVRDVTRSATNKELNKLNRLIQSLSARIGSTSPAEAAP